jgi:glycosyltransferase involved in cell wall biosynthesis
LVSAKKITLWQRAWSKFRLKALGSPSLVVSPTEWLLREHQRRGFFVSGRSEVLLNPGPISERVERQIHDPLRLLFVGRVAEDKGSNMLAGLMHELELPFELRVVGDGPDVEDLKNLDHVTCLGNQSPEEVRRHMLWADILLVPSQIEENQPTVILEAAAVGLPVIAADKGGIKETLGEAGIVCPTHDLESWKQAIKSLNQYPTYQNTVQGMYRLAEKHSIENYSAELNSGFLQKGLSAEMP